MPFFGPSLKLESVEGGRPLGHRPDVISKVSCPGRREVMGGWEMDGRRDFGGETRRNWIEDDIHRWTLPEEDWTFAAWILIPQKTLPGTTVLFLLKYTQFWEEPENIIVFSMFRNQRSLPTIQETNKPGKFRGRRTTKRGRTIFASA